LVGDYRPEHLFVLGQSLQAYRFYQARTQDCDAEIESLLQQLAERFESSSALGAQLTQPEVLNDASLPEPPTRLDQRFSWKNGFSRPPIAP